MPKGIYDRGNPPNSLHGGFIESTGNGKLAIDVNPAHQLQRPDPVEAGIRLAEGPSGKGGWPKGRKRRTKLAVLGIPSEVLDTGSQDYARCVRLASAYRKARTRELVISHGYVSSGASALLASAALAYATSRLLLERAATNSEGFLELVKTATKLADSARTNELAAWELCAREAVAQKKSNALNQGLPWVLQDSGRSKPGPKSKSMKAQDIAASPVLPPWEPASMDILEAENDAGRGSKA